MVVSASFGLMSYVCACSSWDGNLFYDSRNVGLHLKNSFKCKAVAAGVTTEVVRHSWPIEFGYLRGF